MNLMLAFASSLNIAFAILFHYIFHCIFHGIWILLVPEFLWKVSKFFWMLGGHAAGCKYYATDVSQTTFWWIWWWGLLGRWKMMKVHQRDQLRLCFPGWNFRQNLVNSRSQDPFFRLPFIKMVLWMMVGARICKAKKAFSCFFLIRVFLIAILIMKIRKILTLVSLCWLTAPKTLQDDPESEWRRKVFQRTEEATSNSWRYWDYHDMYWDYPN